MSEAKIIKVSTNLPTTPDIFFNWFEANFISGLSFGFEGMYFRMATGNMIPLREGDTLTIQIKHDLLSRLQGDFYVIPVDPIYSVLRIKAIQSPHGGTDITVICKTTYPEFESFFWAIWKMIDKDQKESQTNTTIPEKNIRCPKKGSKRFSDWQVAWRKVRGKYKSVDNKYKTLAKLADVGESTIADIIKAGDAGLLD